VSPIQHLAAGIAEAKVPRAFGVLGSGSSLELADAMVNGGVAFHGVHHEASGAIMAGITGRLSGIPGIAMAIKGPGFSNMAPGLSACLMDGLPMIAAVEAYPPGTDWAVRHKGSDHGALAQAVAKGRVQLSETTSFGNVSAWATGEVPGPVVVELTDGDGAVPDPLPAVDDVTEVIKAIEASGQPMIIAGSEALRQGWGRVLSTLSIPVFSTANAKGVIDETLAHAAGVYTGVGLGKTPEALLLAETDLVVGLGLRPTEVLATNLPKPSVNIDTLASADAFGFGAASGPGIVGQALSVLAEKEWGMARTQLVVEKLRVTMMNGDFRPAQIFEAVDRRFDGLVRGVFDVGYFCTIGEHAWRARRPDLCLMSGNGRYMGTSIPMGIGAALHDTKVPTVIFVGDGGIGGPVAELKIAVQAKLPVMVILLSDGGYGSVRTRAIRDGLTQSPLLMDQPSWLNAISGLGLPGVRVETMDGLNDALDHWQPESGPVFIEAGFDADAYQAMIDGIR
jgi:acetolactate synthase-1/2/3 large subunit